MTAALVVLTLLGGSVDVVEGVTEDGKFLVGKSQETGFAGGEDVRWYEPIGGERVMFEDDEAATTWLKSRKLVALIPGRTSPDGKLKLDVTAVAQGSTNKGATWSSSVTLTVVARGPKRAAFLATVTQPFDAYWTPDSKGAVLVKNFRSTSWGPRGMTWVTDNSVADSYRPAWPVVQVLAPKLSAARALKKKWVTEELTLYDGTSLQKREQSVVYFAAGQEPLAQQLAQRLGKNTKVEKLTWASPFDAVIALGDK